MFLSGMLLWLIEHGWVMLLSLVPHSAFPKPLSPEERGAADSRNAGRRRICARKAD